MFFKIICVFMIFIIWWYVIYDIFFLSVGRICDLFIVKECDKGVGILSL